MESDRTRTPCGYLRENGGANKRERASREKFDMPQPDLHRSSRLPVQRNCESTNQAKSIPEPNDDCSSSTIPWWAAEASAEKRSFAVLDNLYVRTIPLTRVDSPDLGVSRHSDTDRESDRTSKACIVDHATLLA